MVCNIQHFLSPDQEAGTLYSPPYSLATPTEPVSCLVFWIHINGENVDVEDEILHVVSRFNNGDESRTAINVDGIKLGTWNRIMLELSHDKPYKVPYTCSTLRTDLLVSNDFKIKIRIYV